MLALGCEKAKYQARPRQVMCSASFKACTTRQPCARARTIEYTAWWLACAIPMSAWRRYEARVASLENEDSKVHTGDQNSQRLRPDG